MDIRELKYRLLQQVEDVVEYLLPLGKRNKDEWCVGSLAGESGESLRVHLRGSKRGVWADFADSSLNGDIIDLWQKTRGCDIGQALREIHDYLGLPREERRKKKYKRPDFPPYERKKPDVIKYLISRKLTQETIELFGIEWDEKNMIFPSYRGDELIHWKKISIYRPEGKKIVTSSPGTEPCLFGWQAVTEESRSIVICEGELDAMSFREYGIQALSLPFGGGKGDKQQWLDFEKDNLEVYDTIYLAVDDDYEGYEAAREIVFRLGQHRCKLVKLPYKDCNDCLTHGVEREAIEEALQNATTVSIEQLRNLAPSPMEPPHSTEMEQFVLSWLLNDHDDKHLIFSNLEADDFYWPSHQMIYKAAVSLHKTGQSLGMASIINQLGILKVYGDVVSRGHLDDLRLIVPGAPIPEVCETVRAMKTRRMLEKAGREIAKISFEELDSTRACSEAQQQILTVTQREISRGHILTLAEAMAPVLKDIEYNMQHPNEIRGLPTGLRKVDLMLRGMKPGQLIIVAGRPSMGKTAYLLNIVHETVVVAQRPCLLFSMEMSDRELFYRLISIQTGIQTRDMKAGTITKEQFDIIADWYFKVSTAPLYVQDTSNMTPDMMQLTAERMKIRFGDLGLIAVDYLQLMESDERRRDMSINDKVSSISRGLKRIAKTMECPVLAAAQLSRAVEARQDKRPMLSDLRDSGAVEQDADIVKFLYRDEYYHPKKTERPGIAEVIIAKQREGPTGTIELVWDAKCTRFRNIIERLQDPMPPM